MCETFFLTNTLKTLIVQIEQEFAKDEHMMASKAAWQKSTGQMFLHEMMHLNSVGTPHSQFTRSDH
jgi:hypothetical protein